MNTIEMRERRVYLLPDGREVIALKGGRFGFFKLYDPLAWKYLGPALYEADTEGRITSSGRPTPWRVNDLKDAGHAAPQRH